VTRTSAPDFRPAAATNPSIIDQVGVRGHGRADVAALGVEQDQRAGLPGSGENLFQHRDPGRSILTSGGGIGFEATETTGFELAVDELCLTPTMLTG
jgi:hypothetical protein